MSFTIYPAIDLRNGRVVRLRQGDPDRETVFGDDPQAVAQLWSTAGCQWLHVVNLDGAFDEAGRENWRVLPALCELAPKVQFGGGLRTRADIDRALDAGAARVILGTAAVENRALVAEAITRYGPERILIAIDARNGKVRTRGWRAGTAVTAVNLGLQVRALGASTVVYTDIGRDGVLTGVCIDSTVELATATGLEVIASGGVSSLEDLSQLLRVGEGITGVVIGRALYEGRIDLGKALDLVKLHGETS